MRYLAPIALVALFLASSCSSKQDEKGGPMPSCKAFFVKEGEIYDITIVDSYYGTGFSIINGNILCRSENPFKEEFNERYNEDKRIEKCNFLFRSYRGKVKKVSNTELKIYELNSSSKKSISGLDIVAILNRDLDPGKFSVCSI